MKKKATLIDLVCMAAERVPEPLIKTEVHTVKHLTLVPLIKLFMIFLKALMMCLNPKFRPGPNLSFFGLGPWAIIHGVAKLEYSFISPI